MASTNVVTSLPLASQAAVLQSFVASQGASLTDAAACSICTLLSLEKPAEAKGLARRLKTALAAHGISVKHTHALEAVSKLCGIGSWMRTRQMMLALGESDEEQKYALQPVENSTDSSPIEVFESLPAVASRLLEIVRQRIPAQVAPGLCTLHRGPKAITVEVERVGGPRLSFFIWAVRPANGVYALGELPGAEVMEFGKRLERTLEYSHPGLFVTAATFCPSLPHWYYLTLLAHHKGEQRSTVLTGDLEFFIALESIGLRSEADADAATLTARGGHDELTFQAVWVSGEDDKTATTPLLPGQFKSLVQRYFRLRRVSGMSFRDFFLRLAHGSSDAKDFFQIDTDEFDNARKRRGLSWDDVARRTDLPVAELLRIQKYGMVHETVIPKLADALELKDGNALLPDEGEQSVGVHLQEGSTLLKALADTHIWSTLISDSIVEEERETVEGLAESIREYVELVQFSEGELGKTMKNVEPIERGRIAGHIQEHLDELDQMGVAVLVSKSVRFTQGEGRLAGMNGMALHRSGLYFERKDKLEPKFTVHPQGAQHAAAGS